MAEQQPPPEDEQIGGAIRSTSAAPESSTTGEKTTATMSVSPSQLLTKEYSTSAATSDASKNAASDASKRSSSPSTKGASSDASKNQSSVPSKSPGTSDTSKTETSEGLEAEDKETKSRRARKGPLTFDKMKVGFLGAGKMTEAIIKGLISQKLNPKQIFVYSKSGKNNEQFTQLQVNIIKRSYDIFGRVSCDLIFLTLHGHAIFNCYKVGGSRPMALCTNYIPTRNRPYYILSLIGGVSINDVKQVLLNPEESRRGRVFIYRVMLNTAVAHGIGLGAIDVEVDSKKTPMIVRETLTKIAKIEYCPEKSMDVLCAVGGNGLAFVYYFIAALSDGGFKMGMPKKAAVKLACEAMKCASSCLIESGKSAQELRDNCLAPSGPGVYGLAYLNKRDCASGIAQAIDAAHKRILELAVKPQL